MWGKKVRDTVVLSGKLKNKGLNLHTLSEKSGVSYSTVYNLFKGEKSVKDAKAESVYKIASELGVSMDYLYNQFVQSESDRGSIMPDFTLMWQDEEMGEVHIGESNVHIDKYVRHPVKQIFYKDEITRFEFGEIMRSRCWDENRQDIKELLSSIGLMEYNPFQICIKTHGRMVQDMTWFRFEGEDLRYEDFKR